MCNLYSETKGQEAIRAAARVMRDVTGNLPIFPGIFPDYSAPIVRNAPDGVRELSTARWGMPSSQFALMESAKKRAAKLEAKGKPVDFKELLRLEPDIGTTNIRNLTSKRFEKFLHRHSAPVGKPGVIKACLFTERICFPTDPDDQLLIGRLPDPNNDRIQSETLEPPFS